MAKYCPNCRSHLSSSARFCSECGATIAVRAQPQKSGASGCVLVLVGTAVLICGLLATLGGLGSFATTRGAGTSSTTSQPPPQPTPVRADQCAGMPDHGLSCGARAEVFETASCLNVRQSPSRAATALRCMPDGTNVVVTGGPEFSEDIAWLAIDNQGWVNAVYIRAVSRVPPTPLPPVVQNVQAIPNDGKLYCLQENQACLESPEWLARNGGEAESVVTFAFAPGLRAQRVFVESIWLLSQWSEGRLLLSEAGSHNVTVLGRTSSAGGSIATYTRRGRTVHVNQEYLAGPIWMTAVVLAHELKHAADDRAGLWAQSSIDCLAMEQAAYQTEKKFTQYLTTRFGVFPTSATMQATLNQAEMSLFANIARIHAARSVNELALSDYRVSCQL